MKKSAAILVSLALIVGLLAGCGGSSKKPDFTFENQLTTAVDICISSTSASYWGDPVTAEPIPAGETGGMTFESFEGTAGTYDLAAVDGAGMVYAAYGIPLAEDDKLILSSSVGEEGEPAYSLTVTSAEGTAAQYEVFAYDSNEIGTEASAAEPEPEKTETVPSSTGPEPEVQETGSEVENEQHADSDVQASSEDSAAPGDGE